MEIERWWKHASGPKGRSDFEGCGPQNLALLLYWEGAALLGEESNLGSAWLGERKSDVCTAASSFPALAPQPLTPNHPNQVESGEELYWTEASKGHFLGPTVVDCFPVAGEQV